jgi:hypothetical protein
MYVKVTARIHQMVLIENELNIIVNGIKMRFYEYFYNHKPFLGVFVLIL